MRNVLPWDASIPNATRGRAAGFAGLLRDFFHHRAGVLVLADSFERCLLNQAAFGPAAELDLGHELRFEVVDLLPAAPRRGELLELADEDRVIASDQSRADVAGVVELAVAVVVADQHRADAVGQAGR